MLQQYIYNQFTNLILFSGTLFAAIAKTISIYSEDFNKNKNVC